MQTADGEESWSFIEDECLKTINDEPDYERDLITYREYFHKRVWLLFQDSASAIAHLYRDRANIGESSAHWIPFQTAAGTVTSLYKESFDSLKRQEEKGIRCGYQKRTKDITEWVKNKRRRYIRREELLSYLAGRTTQNVQSSGLSRRTSPKSDISIQPSSLTNLENISTHEPVDLNVFTEALVRKPRGPELYAFVASEIARNSKRSANNLDNFDLDVNMESVNSKRGRFF